MTTPLLTLSDVAALREWAGVVREQYPLLGAYLDTIADKIERLIQAALSAPPKEAP